MKRDGAFMPLGVPSIIWSPNGANILMSRNRVICAWFLLSLSLFPCVVLSEEVSETISYSVLPETTTTEFGKYEVDI